MPREPPPWKGARTIIKGKKASVVGEEGAVIANTVGNLHGGGYFNGNRHPKGEWIITSILNRGTLLWDRDYFQPLEHRYQSIHEHYSEDSGDCSTPQRLLVGYSAYTLEPVLASADAARLDMYSDVDDLSGLELEVPSEGTLSPSEVILHHALTVPGNLRAVKQLLIEKSWEIAFADGDITVEDAKNMALESARSLFNEQAPVVVARIKPPTITQVPYRKTPNLEQCVKPDRPHGPGNRRFREILPIILPHLHINYERATFLYHAPYISNMRYPPRLYSDLAAFANAHVNDKFNATAMLLAAQLWPCSYFEHWLKIHENLQCIAFAHPFRVIQRMYINDILTHDGRAFLIDESAIDSGRVRDLTYEAKAIDPRILVDERMDFFPFMINGTKMVLPQNLSGFFRPSPTELALLGMPDLRILSHPSLSTTDSVKIEIAIPKAIAQATFCTEIMCDYSFIDSFGTNGATSLFGSSSKSGTIWTHEFQMYTHWSGLSMEAYIKPDMIDVWPQVLDRRMAWLQNLGVLGKVRVRTGEDDLPSYYGMPSENESCNIDDAAMEKMVDRALEDPRNWLADGAERHLEC
ncbi:hypothetical protein FOXG_01345 [Fusarium oxysporum f. sp. lycopersici 4287]|uniref:Uncharacterized protein n=1 Tax=Fusarium oxysporum f. sp. lycopersici (strain 4287 / CBS 123668 / FGSC 9935 / NRRL 34936) TaxID=426428 RepID=A0A0J9WH12_FUSO4|nr:hypothetical protein FOXG_01345 [Fusarium oxysporum f. sp. lycopersici 4287]KAJ9427946.1 hypothetical protein QL093DRAFT_2091135 [Fusarium oxysporum]KNA95976.1 hypothetical protein FOXG_01345 [Fusarium oxysporum f. sp. lycopersici 4287]